jgi:hypothetical protein
VLLSFDSSLFYSVEFSDKNRELNEDISQEAYRLSQILNELPKGKSKQLAFEKLKECTMWANVALAQQELKED